MRMKDILDIDEIRRRIPKMTIHYDWGEEILIVKFMVGVTHNLCAGMFRRYFERSGPGDDFLDSFLLLKSSRVMRPTSQLHDTWKGIGLALLLRWMSLKV